jgi:hypothetical protein
MSNYDELRTKVSELCRQTHEEIQRPYGIPKEHGGDSPENVAKMEKCVRDVMKQGKDKESAIRICKNSVFPMKAEAAAREDGVKKGNSDEVLRADMKKANLVKNPQTGKMGFWVTHKGQHIFIDVGSKKDLEGKDVGEIKKLKERKKAEKAVAVVKEEQRKKKAERKKRIAKEQAKAEKAATEYLKGRKRKKSVLFPFGKTTKKK